MASNADDIREIIPERPPRPKRSSLIKRRAPEPPSVRVLRKEPAKLKPTNFVESTPEKPKAPFHPFDNLNDEDCEITFQEINLDDVSEKNLENDRKDEIFENTPFENEKIGEKIGEKIDVKIDVKINEKTNEKNNEQNDETTSLPDSIINSNHNFHLKSRSTTLINEQPPPPNFNPAPDNFQTEAVIKKSTKLAPINNDQIYRSVSASGKSSCYGCVNVGKAMRIVQKRRIDAFILRVGTFAEFRKVVEKIKPHPPELLSVPKGKIPDIWALDIPAENYNTVQETLFYHDLENTEEIEICHLCDVNRKIVCQKCLNWDTEEYKQTNFNLLCKLCGNSRKVLCTDCRGFGRIIRYKRVEIQLEIFRNEYLLNKSDLPDGKIKNTPFGEVIHEEFQCEKLVAPVRFIYPEIDHFSQTFLMEHAERIDKLNGRLVKQSQELIQVPVCEVHYILDKAKSRMFVFGVDNDVYFDKFNNKFIC